MSETEKSKLTINRRRFLKLTGWAAAGVTILVTANAARSFAPALPTLNDPTSEDSLTWLQMLPSGKVRFFYPRMEMGQGATLGLSQIVAEELNLTQNDIECVLPDTSQVPPFKMTVGSESIKSFYPHVSFGAATLREKLRHIAAVSSGFTTSDLTDHKGGFKRPNGKVLLYSDIPTAEASIHITSTPQDTNSVQQYTKRDNSKFHAIGQPWPDHNLQDIVTGKTIYSRDVSIPGMLYGKIAKPPAFGAKLLSINPKAAQKTPGFVKLVLNKSDNFVGVIADTQHSLEKSFAALSVKWSTRATSSSDILADKFNIANATAQDNFEHTIQNAGNLQQGRSDSRYNISATYKTPFAAHAAIEPRTGVCHVREQQVDVWCGTQDPFFVQKRIAKKLGLHHDKVVVHPQRIGGGFGGRVICQASEEAAVLSASVSSPVKVQWDRDEEFRNNYFQPAYEHFIEAGVSENGDIQYWDHGFISSPIITGPVSFENNLVSKIASTAIDTFSSDEGTLRGGVSPYTVPNRRLRYSDIRTEVPIGAWKGLGSAPNNFAIESMIDELAAASHTDPLEFRIKNLPSRENRLIEVIKTVESISDWRQELSKNQGKGIACGIYKNMTFVATVVKITIDHEKNNILINNAFCAHDCGLIVNPDQVKKMISGNIIWGCSMALKEQITIQNGQVEEDNFDGYEITRMEDTPDITISLIDSNHAPSGAGESAFMTVAPAITNAIFSATGKRVRSLPVSYEAVFA